MAAKWDVEAFHTVISRCRGRLSANWTPRERDDHAVEDAASEGTTSWKTPSSRRLHRDRRWSRKSSSRRGRTRKGLRPRPMVLCCAPMVELRFGHQLRVEPDAVE